MSDIDKKIVFGAGPAGDGSTALFVGLPKLCWDEMQGGRAQTLDLSSIGLDIKLIIFGAADHDSAMSFLTKTFNDAGLPVLDRRRENFAIKDKPS